MSERIPVSRPFLWQDEKRYLEAALAAGWLSGTAPPVEELERRFAALIGVAHAVAAASGTAALHLAVEALGLGAGDEVVVPDFCMISPVLALLQCRAVPVPVDADDTWNLDPAAIEEQITPRTRAILAVHTYGHPADMARIAEIARRRGLLLIEDGAEALGGSVAGRPVGSFGDVACFSFYANKVITTGEGGMLVTRDPELAARARWKRNLCFGPDDESRFVHREIGYNYRLSSLQAAVGLGQLEHLQEAVAAKIEIARLYREELAGIPGLELPPCASWAENVYWVFGLVVDEEFGASRRALQQRLREAGIETRRFFSPVHAQPILEPLRPRAGARSFPRSERLAAHGLYLPSFVGMTAAQVARVAAAVREP